MAGERDSRVHSSAIADYISSLSVYDVTEFLPGESARQAVEHHEMSTELSIRHHIQYQQTIQAARRFSSKHAVKIAASNSGSESCILRSSLSSISKLDIWDRPFMKPDSDDWAFCLEMPFR